MAKHHHGVPDAAVTTRTPCWFELFELFAMKQKRTELLN
jgi:hypothetical protein